MIKRTGKHHAVATWRSAGLVLTLLMLIGCAGPRMGERQAFERWHQLDERTYQLRTHGPDPRSPSPATAKSAEHDLPNDAMLDDYLRYAAEHSPGLQAAFYEWKAALERVPQARALMDPQLSYSYFLRESMTRQTVGLSQMLPWYEKLQARGDVALAEAMAAEQRFNARLWQVHLQVKQAYAEYAYLARAVAVMETNVHILRDMQAGAMARFESGDVPYADVVRADVALEQARDEVRSLRERRGPVVGQLNAALGREVKQPLPWPEALHPASLTTDETQLLAALARLNPELEALRHETAGRRHAHRLARQNRIPDLMLGVEYMDMVPMDMRDQVAVMASINLPIWPERLRAEQAEALAAFGAATRRQMDRQNELEASLRLAWYRYQDANRRALLFERTLIPMSREALQATQAAYAAGQAEFQAMTQAQTVLQEMQLTFERTVTDRFQALAELEQLVGQRLDQ